MCMSYEVKIQAGELNELLVAQNKVRGAFCIFLNESYKVSFAVYACSQTSNSHVSRSHCSNCFMK